MPKNNEEIDKWIKLGIIALSAQAPLMAYRMLFKKKVWYCSECGAKNEKK